MDTGLLSRFEELLNQSTDIDEIIPEIEEIKSKFQSKIELKQKKLLAEFVAEGGEPGNFVAPKFEEQAKYNDLIYIVKERQQKKEEEIKKIYHDNLLAKKEIIQQLSDLIENEENISRAFNTMNELREKWTTIGPVSSHDYKTVQNEYSNLLEQFFYHINIYRELKNHDLKRNMQLREELIEKMRQLLEEKSMKNVRSLAGQYLGEWDEIGPVQKEDWEKLRDAFRALTREVYDKVKEHYKTIKEKRQANFAEKQKLVEMVKEISEMEINNIKTWKKKTEEVLQIQQDWKKIGFAVKKENDAIWEEFRQFCNAFFDKKNTFLKGERSKWDENKKRKLRIVEQAESLKESTDWRETSEKMIRLQKDWQRIGPASQKDEQKLWTQFRAAADFFFNAKKEYYDTLDDRLAENLKKKKELIGKIESTEIKEKEKGSEVIKTFIEEWDALGMVPKENVKEINNSYQKAIDKLYGKLGLDEEVVNNKKFTDKVEQLRKSDKAQDLLKDEQRFIRERIDVLKKEVLQYENNLSFFGFSKGKEVEKMKQDVMQNISKVEKQIEGWKKKLRLLSEALKEMV